MNPEKIKEKNTNALRKSGIEVIDWLPYLDLTESRSSKDVAKRSVILAALLQLHFEAPNDFIEEYLKTNGLFEELSAREKKLLAIGHEDWPGQEKIDLEWSIEAIWAMQWAGGKHKHLTFNSYVEDSLAAMLPNFANNEPADDYIQNFTLISEERIFSELDKFYRAHWYARNKNIENIKDHKVNLSIIMERRKALEWICDKALSWDDIRLNT